MKVDLLQAVVIGLLVFIAACCARIGTLLEKKSPQPESEASDDE